MDAHDTDTVRRTGLAMGMVSVQAECNVDEALVLMDARANVSRTTLAEIVTAVLDGSIRFDE